VLLDTRGLVLASRVGPAHGSDAAAAIACWDEAAAIHPLLGQLQVVMGDSSFAGLFAEHLRAHDGWRFEKPAHSVLNKKRQPPLVERRGPALAPGQCLAKLGEYWQNSQIVLTTNG